MNVWLTEVGVIQMQFVQMKLEVLVVLVIQNILEMVLLVLVIFK